MQELLIVLGVFGGAIFGFGVRHFLGPRKTYTINSIEGVVSWIKDRPPEDSERIMYGIVRKVYGGKMHLHTNPVKKAKVHLPYPTSEK